MQKLKLPQIIGHRGVAAYAPENTLEGIHTAADMALAWVELDELTQEEIPILFHDDTLDRTTNSSGWVAQTTYADLKELEAGSWFSDSFSGVSIPTLEEAIDALLERKLALNLEIKPCPGREILTAETVLDLLANCWDDHARLLISSFDIECMRTARDMAQDWARALILPQSTEWPDRLEDLVEELELTSLHFNGNATPPDDLDRLLAFNIPLLAYTINAPQHARHLQEKGVWGFFSDAPDTIEDSILRVQ